MGLRVSRFRGLGVQGLGLAKWVDLEFKRI